MKQKLIPAIAVIFLSLISCYSFAQNEPSSSPRWVSEKGYWVAESNIHSPLDHVIRFYNNDNVLVYKETLSGVKLNLNKRKVKMKLKKVLDSSVLAWEKKKEGSEENALVKTILQ